MVWAAAVAAGVAAGLVRHGHRRGPHGTWWPSPSEAILERDPASGSSAPTPPGVATAAGKVVQNVVVLLLVLGLVRVCCNARTREPEPALRPAQ